jgi:hypothetical protein
MKEVSVLFLLKCFQIIFVSLQGTKIQIRGVEDIPRHVDVPIAVCDDPDPFKYPKGLLCAGEDGNNISFDKKLL